MLNLREKAHYSLDEYKKGRGSPLSKYGLSPVEPNSPTNNDDELSILGGKTRLVAKKEPSSPTLLDRSPTSQKPVVPINIGRQVPPSILEYLNSFNPQEPHQSQGISSHMSRHDSIGSNGSHNLSAYSDDVSPTSMYGMSTVVTSPTFQTETEAYPSHSQHYAQASPTHQYSPHHISYPDGPLRRTPVPAFQPALLGGLDLGPDGGDLGGGEELGGLDTGAVSAAACCRRSGDDISRAVPYPQQAII